MNLFQKSRLIILIIFILPYLSMRHSLPQSNNRQKIQEAVDKVRMALQDSLGIPVPSLNVLIQTPSDKFFICSAQPGAQMVTPGTHFRFASNTKNFTAASVLNMYEDGWIDYKAKITALIPGSQLTYVPVTPDWNFPNRDSITIEQLLQHSSGVYDVDNDTVPGCNNQSYTEYTQQRDPVHQFTTTEMVKVLTVKQLSYFMPGKGHHYSNTGYSILSEIIRRVYSFHSKADKTYAEYLTDSITGKSAKVPLANVHFPVKASDTAMPEPFVKGTVYSTSNIKHYGNYNMSAQTGEGNGYGTMNDLNTYIRALMKGQNVLRPDVVHLMQSSISPGDEKYALGCTLTPNLGYGHNGARIGYISVMAYDPLTDVSVVSMIPLWDLRKGSASFGKCINAVYDAAYVARAALGFSGRPLK